ncbi:conserved hypothetical protein [Beggiatoa sp. PS]|nr:conserved hypothetical protein [Beggiatoa sp. PS]
MATSLAFELKSYHKEISSFPPTKLKITQAEYWDEYYNAPDVTYEWNNGELEEKGVSDVVTVLTYKWFWELLEHYLRIHPIAESVLLFMGFNLTLPQKTAIYRPDLGVVLNSNPVPLKPEDRNYKGTYDLCVEAISDSKPKDIKRDTIDKKADYAKGGVKEYYILDGHDRYTEFYRLNQSGIYVPIQRLPGEIIQSTVLPGFQFRAADLFTKPSLDKMIDDLVYQDFVLPEYREAKQKAKAEKQARQLAEAQIRAEKEARQAEKQGRQLAEVQIRAEKEARQAEKKARQQAEQRAERLAKQLRVLGINPDDI